MVVESDVRLAAVQAVVPEEAEKGGPNQAEARPAAGARARRLT